MPLRSFPRDKIVMTIKTKLIFKDYVKLIFTLAYERLILRLLVGVAFIILLWIICYYTEVFDLPKPLIYQYITFVLIAIVQPMGIFLIARRTFKSSNQLQETSLFEIASNLLIINGESYYMEIEWEKFFEIVEKPRWFLLYQNSLSAILISKKNMNEDEIDRFREILQNIEGVPLKLNETPGIIKSSIG